MEFYGQATKAKEETIIGQEKEQVEIAYASVAINKLGDDVTAQDLQNELDKSVGATKTLVTPNGDGTLNVLFNGTDHNYNVNKGSVTRTEILVYGEKNWYIYETVSDGIKITGISEDCMIGPNLERKIENENPELMSKVEEALSERERGDARYLILRI